MNKVLISGHVGKEPTIKTTTSGKKVATFPIAVNDGWGERQQTYWHTVVAWEKKADFVEKYVHQKRASGSPCLQAWGESSRPIDTRTTQYVDLQFIDFRYKICYNFSSEKR